MRPARRPSPPRRPDPPANPCSTLPYPTCGRLQKPPTGYQSLTRPATGISRPPIASYLPPHLGSKMTKARTAAFHSPRWLQWIRPVVNSAPTSILDHWRRTRPARHSRKAMSGWHSGPEGAGVPGLRTLGEYRSRFGRDRLRIIGCLSHTADIYR